MDSSPRHHESGGPRPPSQPRRPWFYRHWTWRRGCTFKKPAVKARYIRPPVNAHWLPLSPIAQPVQARFTSP